LTVPVFKTRILQHVVDLLYCCGCGMGEMKIRQGNRREGRKEAREEDMKEVLIKLYRTV
jgi:hypothetical protein